MTHLQRGLVVERVLCFDGALQAPGGAVVEHLILGAETDAGHGADEVLHIYIYIHPHG